MYSSDYEYPLCWQDFMVEHKFLAINGKTPCMTCADVECMIRHYFPNRPLELTKVNKNRIDSEIITKAICNLMSEGCTGSIHFYKDGEVRIEIT